MRSKKKILRDVDPDPKYNRKDIAKFTNYIMKRGEKTKAQKILYKSFDIIKKKTDKNPLDVFDKAIDNVSPRLEVRSRRIGGANYQIPYKTDSQRRFVLASKWILDAARSKKGQPMAKKLALELIQASKGEGSAFKKKESVHRMAKANKAFAHFAN